MLMMQVFVSAEIAVYEYDCTGASRKPEALTDEYKAECDARPHCGDRREGAWTHGAGPRDLCGMRLSPHRAPGSGGTAGRVLGEGRQQRFGRYVVG
jgi:hypothetical protein